MIVYKPKSRDIKRYGILCTAFLILGALLLTGCGPAASHTPPPATVIRATEEISPTLAIEEEEPSPTPEPVSPTPASTEPYPYPPAASTPQEATTPVAYPTK